MFIAYTAVSGITMLAAGGIVYGLYSTAPGDFERIGTTLFGADTAAHAHHEIRDRVRPDSLTAMVQNAPQDTVAHNASDLVPHVTVDPNPALSTPTSAELRAAHLAQQRASADSSLRAMGKMLEGLKADQAALILNRLSTNEAKVVLSSMNRRQATKIIGVLDPSRAARILR